MHELAKLTVGLLAIQLFHNFVENFQMYGGT